MKIRPNAIFWILLLVGINQVVSQNNTNVHLVEFDSIAVMEEHKLDLPVGAISLNFSNIFEVDGKPMLFAYCYPRQHI